MEKYLDPEYLLSLFKSVWEWLLQSVFTVGTLLEIIIIAIALLIFPILARSFNNFKIYYKNISLGTRGQIRMKRCFSPFWLQRDIQNHTLFQSQSI